MQKVLVQVSDILSEISSTTGIHLELASDLVKKYQQEDLVEDLPSSLIKLHKLLQHQQIHWQPGSPSTLLLNLQEKTENKSYYLRFGKNHPRLWERLSLQINEQQVFLSDRQDLCEALSVAFHYQKSAYQQLLLQGIRLGLRFELHSNPAKKLIISAQGLQNVISALKIIDRQQLPDNLQEIHLYPFRHSGFSDHLKLTGIAVYAPPQKIKSFLLAICDNYQDLQKLKQKALLLGVNFSDLDCSLKNQLHRLQQRIHLTELVNSWDRGLKVMFSLQPGTYIELGYDYLVLPNEPGALSMSLLDNFLKTQQPYLSALLSKAQTYKLRLRCELATLSEADLLLKTMRALICSFEQLPLEKNIGHTFQIFHLETAGLDYQGILLLGQDKFIGYAKNLPVSIHGGATGVKTLLFNIHARYEYFRNSAQLSDSWLQIIDKSKNKLLSFQTPYRATLLRKASGFIAGVF